MYLRNKLQGYTVERRRFVDGKLWWCLILRWADNMAPVGKNGFLEDNFSKRLANTHFILL